MYPALAFFLGVCLEIPTWKFDGTQCSTKHLCQTARHLCIRDALAGSLCSALPVSPSIGIQVVNQGGLDSSSESCCAILRSRGFDPILVESNPTEGSHYRQVLNPFLSGS